MRLCAITAYFNPMGYVTRRANYERFAADLTRRGVDLLTIECVLAGREAELSGQPFGSIITVQAKDILWHKERLLNLAIRHLSDDVEAVAWVDCDLLFENSAWPADVIRLLDRFHLVQLFSAVTHLPPEAATPDADADWIPSYGAKLASAPSAPGIRFAEHGHTGFAWAARKSSIEDVGLFDVCIAGGADHLMAHAFSGDWRVRCVDRLLGRQSPLRRHFDAWSERLNRVIDGKIGVCTGRLLHLWHGSLKQRRYFARNDRLLKLGFDPARDLTDGPDGCWAWADHNAPAARFVSDYMAGRQEDG